MVRRRVRTAASTTNNVVEKIVEMDAVKFIKPMVYVSKIRLNTRLTAHQHHFFGPSHANPLV